MGERPLNALLLERANNRTGHISLSHGSFIITWGGFNPKNKAYYPTNEFIFLNLETDEWFLRLSNGASPADCSGTTACVYNDEIYVFGGWHRRTVSIRDFYSSNIPESSVIIFSTDDIPNLGGGSVSFGFMSNSIWKIGLKSMTWKELSPKGTPPLRCDKSTSWFFQNKFFIFGGFGPPPTNGTCRPKDSDFTFEEKCTPGTDNEGCIFGWSNQLITYDILTNTIDWPICKGSAPSPRAGLASCIMGEKVYIFGGRSLNDRKNDLFSLNLRSLLWTQILPNTQEHNHTMPEGRTWHSITKLITGKQEGGILLYGGFDSSHNIINDCWKMDLAIKPLAWQRLRHLEKGARLWHTMHTLNDNKVIILGGVIGSIVDPELTDHACPLWKLTVNPKSLQESTLGTIEENREFLNGGIQSLPYLLKRTIQEGNLNRDQSNLPIPSTLSLGDTL